MLYQQVLQKYDEEPKINTCLHIKVIFTEMDEKKNNFFIYIKIFTVTADT